MATNPRLLGARIGVLAVLHTWNQMLGFHPHSHCLVPAGGLSVDGERWIRSRKKFFLPVKVLRVKFRGKLLALLRQAYEQRELRFPDYRALILSAHDPINDAHPDRYKRFIVSGEGSHTALQPQFFTAAANGVLLNDWTSDFLVSTPFWVDIVEDFAPIP